MGADKMSNKKQMGDKLIDYILASSSATPVFITKKNKTWNIY